MLSWLQRLLRRATPAPLPAITADITGFTLTHARHARAVPWVSVARVSAFKRDLHTHDEIVLLIELSHPVPETLTLPESCPGFSQLFRPMEEALGVDPIWYLTIMTPVFEPTPVALYLRAPEALGH